MLNLIWSRCILLQYFRDLTSPLIRIHVPYLLTSQHLLHSIYLLAAGAGLASGEMVFFALRADCRLNMARMSPLRVGVAAVAADDRRGLPLPGMVPVRCCQEEP